jgi:CDP-6-deoxy-D-xylo-4-hexulose-3-dehydrase
LKENASIGRKDLQVYLENKNIQTRPVFAGNIARQPGFKHKTFKISGSLENADYVMKNALVIGCHQGMSDDQVNWVHECLREIFK